MIYLLLILTILPIILLVGTEAGARQRSDRVLPEPRGHQGQQDRCAGARWRGPGARS